MYPVFSHLHALAHAVPLAQDDHSHFSCRLPAPPVRLLKEVVPGHPICLHLLSPALEVISFLCAANSHQGSCEAMECLWMVLRSMGSGFGSWLCDTCRQLTSLNPSFLFCGMAVLVCCKDRHCSLCIFCVLALSALVQVSPLLPEGKLLKGMECITLVQGLGWLDGNWSQGSLRERSLSYNLTADGSAGCFLTQGPGRVVPDLAWSPQGWSFRHARDKQIGLQLRLLESLELVSSPSSDSGVGKQ